MLQVGIGLLPPPENGCPSRSLKFDVYGVSSSDGFENQLASSSEKKSGIHGVAQAQPYDRTCIFYTHFRRVIHLPMKHRWSADQPPKGLSDSALTQFLRPLLSELHLGTVFFFFRDAVVSACPLGPAPRRRKEHLPISPEELWPPARSRLDELDQARRMEFEVHCSLFSGSD